MKAGVVTTLFSLSTHTSSTSHSLTLQSNISKKDPKRLKNGPTLSFTCQSRVMGFACDVTVLSVLTDKDLGLAYDVTYLSFLTDEELDLVCDNIVPS
jgi:hypothetical protein